jgi:hypothetical protein
VIEFENGILFPDVITLNFSLSMDPHRQRPIGSGELVFSVVIAPVCQQSVYSGFPNSPTTFVGCGGYVSESVGSLAPGKALLFPFYLLPFNPRSVELKAKIDVTNQPKYYFLIYFQQCSL